MAANETPQTSDIEDIGNQDIADVGNLDTVFLEETMSEEDLKEFYKLILPSQSIEDLGLALERENKALHQKYVEFGEAKSIEKGDSEFSQQLTTVGSYIELLKRMVDAHTDQTIFMSEMLKRIKDPTQVGDAYEYKASSEDETSFTLKNKVMKLDKSLNGADVSGHQAKMLILAANHNVKRIYLYNSGFNIVVRGPSLVEMNLVYNRLAEEMNSYGRMLGAIFYTYSDFKIKSIIWEFINSLVIGSNLNKWDKNNRLRDNIDIHDYNPIILGIGTLMFKNGYDFVHVCTNDTCKHAVTEVIDLNLFQLTDFSRIPREQLKFMAANTLVNPEHTRAYKKALNLDNTLNIGQYRIYCRVPSLTNYFTNGAAFNEELSMSVHDIDDPNMVDQYLKYNYSQLFEPWISHMEFIDEATSQPSFKLADHDSITLALTQIQNSEHNEAFTEQMNQFIQETAMTNVGYLATPCVKCNTPQTGLVNGFVPFDAQNSFFTMLVMRLIQTS